MLFEINYQKKGFELGKWTEHKKKETPSEM